MKVAKRFLFTFLWLVFMVAARAQQPKAIDSLNNKINLYGIKNQSPVLFIHFDKNVYSTGEGVWFTAYLLNATDLGLYKTLSLTLVKDDDRSIILENKFNLKDGLSLGHTVIPAANPGNYSFIATTNRLKNGQPEVVFTQPITIKTLEQQEFTADLEPIDTAVTATQQKVLLAVNFMNIDPVAVRSGKIPAPSAVVSYYVGNNANQIIKGFGKTQDNRYTFTIPSKILSPGSNWLHVQVSYKNDVKQLNMALPTASRSAVVRFYPEGGNLVNNLQNTMGWEVKSAAGNPMGVNGVLYENTKIIDTIETGSSGLGKFTIIPKAGKSYSVKLYKINKQDTSYTLPVALTQGPVLSLGDAVVNDTLVINLKDEQKEKLYLIGHNYKQVFFITPVNMTVSAKKLKFIIKDIPKGLTQLTLTDSIGRPFSQRLFFAHYNQREPVSITTDKSEYDTRQKVNVQLKLDANQPDSGLVSIACVQENRIDLKKANDIESYFYLKHDLGDLPVRETYLANDEDKQFLENVLLIKGWRRYTWTDVLKANPADTIRKYQDMVLKGNVTEHDKSLTKSVTLVNMNHPIDRITTDKTGAFTLTNVDLFVDSGKKAKFMVNDPDPQLYTVRVPDPYSVTNELLAVKLMPKDYSAKGQANTKYMEVPDDEHAIHLKAVNIKGSNNDAFYGMLGGNDLNSLQQISTSSISGKHQGYDYSSTTNIFTAGPTGYMVVFNGLYGFQEFYPPDIPKLNPSEAQYLSTLYWKHLVKISSRNSAVFSFYTGDITGKFKIVVQGITGGDVAYGETTFDVLKPNN